ncbi:MAG: hypothetical protein Q8K60_05870 [Parachlamydiaceae bacterium]|nr:hypothetical protein [Parachlamydiaceae bacterium]
MMNADRKNIHSTTIKYVPLHSINADGHTIENQKHSETYKIAKNSLRISGLAFLTCGILKYPEGMIASLFIASIAFSVINAISKLNRLKESSLSLHFTETDINEID